MKKAFIFGLTPATVGFLGKGSPDASIEKGFRWKELVVKNGSP